VDNILDLTALLRGNMQIMFMFAVQTIIGVYDRFAERIFKLIMIKPISNMFLFVVILGILMLSHFWAYAKLASIMDSDSFQMLFVVQLIVAVFVYQPVIGLVLYKVHKSYSEPAMIEFFGSPEVKGAIRVARARSLSTSDKGDES